MKPWRNSSRNTIGQTLHELRTVDDDGHAVETSLDRATAVRDINIAGFGLFNTREIAGSEFRRRLKAGERATLEGVMREYGLPDSGLVLAVPNTSVKVAEHLEGSDWQHGAWKDALRQCPVAGVMITDSAINRQQIDGTQQRCTLIVLDRYHAAPEK